MEKIEKSGWRKMLFGLRQPMEGKHAKSLTTIPDFVMLLANNEPITPLIVGVFAGKRLMRTEFRRLLQQAAYNGAVQIIHGSPWAECLGYCPPDGHFSKPYGTIYQWKKESQRSKAQASSWHCPWDRSGTNCCLVPSIQTHSSPASLVGVGDFILLLKNIHYFCEF